MDSVLTMMSSEEQVLVSRAQAEPAAWTAIYDLYFSRIYNYAMYRLQDAQAADDVTAQVFERLLTRIGSYRPERGSFASWLFTIARNTINSHLRAQKVRQWVSLDAAEYQLTPSATLEEITARDELLARLMGMIARMDERSRDLIALKFGAGLTNRRIAELTGLSESNVGVALYRAISHLRDQIEPVYEG